MAQIIDFPKKRSSEKAGSSAKKPVLSMVFSRRRNGKTVLTNIGMLSDAEFLNFVVSDAIMAERENLVRKHINE